MSSIFCSGRESVIISHVHSIAVWSLNFRCKTNPSSLSKRIRSFWFVWICLRIRKTSLRNTNHYSFNDVICRQHDNNKNTRKRKCYVTAFESLWWLRLPKAHLLRPLRAHLQKRERQKRVPLLRSRLGLLRKRQLWRHQQQHQPCLCSEMLPIGLVTFCHSLL